MTDVSGNTTSQYAVVAPISVSTDISPSRQTRESSNKFLQEHTILSELKKKGPTPARRLKYVDVEFTNSNTLERLETTKREGPTVVNTNYEDWTVPRPRPRKQPPPPPPNAKPKPVIKAKSIAQMVVPADTAVAGETIKTKARCASETDTTDDDRLQHQPVSNFSLKRPSRKAPPPPKQVQHDKNSVTQATHKSKSPRPLQGSIGSDKDAVVLAPLSPKQRRALSSEKEIVVTDSCPVEGHQVKRTSSFKECKTFRPVRKAPPPPNKSTEFINVAKDEDDVTFSTFFVSHKKAQSLSYENVVCDESDASILATFPRSYQSYENVERPRKVHRSDEGQCRGLSQSYENVLTTRQAIENKLNKAPFQSNNADMNKVDTDSHSDTAVKQQKQETPKSNGGTHYKPGGKKKSIKKRRNISPPRSPPPPPPPPPPLEAAGGLMSPEASSELTTPSPPSSKLKKPIAPPPSPPGTARKFGAPPPRPPPPDESPPSSILPTPPPDETKAVNGEIPPRPPSPLDEPQSVPLVTERLMSKKQQNMIEIVHSGVENSVAPSEQASLNTALLSPPLIMAKKPLTSPPATPPPPPPPPLLPTPRTPSDQKCVNFEIRGSDVESGDAASLDLSISTSSSEASLHQEQIIRQQCNGDVDDDLHADIITNYTTPPDFFGQPSRELDPITEYADTESSGSLYIAQTVSEEALLDQQISSDNSPDLKRLGGKSTLEDSGSRVPLQKLQSPLVETNTLVNQNGGSVLNPDIDSSNNQNMVEQHGPHDGGPSSRDRKETGSNPFWYRESMIMAVGRGNALHGYPSKKRPLPPPRSQPVDPPVIEKMESSPSRIRRPSEGTKDLETSEEYEINLAYMESSSSSSASGSCPLPPPRTKRSIKVPPVAPPRDKSSLSSSPARNSSARNAEKSKAAFTRVRAASFLTVSAGKELNTVTVMYMGSKQVDQFVGKINNIARDLSDKVASLMIMYIATEKIRLAAPDSNVLFQSFAVENILATTLCAINKRIVGMLVWKSRALPSWHLIRCTDNLVAGSVLESIQMACETVKSDEITEVRPLSQASILSSGSSEGLPEPQKVADLFRKFPAIFISDVKVGSAISVNEIIGNVLHTLLPSNSIEVQLWLSIYQVRLINLSTGLLFAQYDMCDIKLFGTLARDKRYLGIVVGNTEKKQPVVCAILRCKTLSHVVMILSYLREACQVSFHENSENPSAALWSRGDDDSEEPPIKSEDDNDEEDEQFALEVLKSFSGPSKSNTVPSPVASRKTLKERLKTLKGTLTGSFDKTPSSPISIPAESTFKSHIQESTSPLTSPSNRKSYLGLLSNPEEYAKFTMCYIGSATLEGVVTGSTVYDALQAIEDGGVAAGAALVPKNQISFVASAMGVTLVDPTQKMFITRHYPKNQIEAFLRGPDKSNILGFVTKMTGFEDKIKCHLLKEGTEPLTQIYSAVEYWLKLDNETLV